jgi:hypothetical protein
VEIDRTAEHFDAENKQWPGLEEHQTLLISPGSVRTIFQNNK